MHATIWVMHNFRNTLLLLLLCSSPLNCASDSKVDVLQGQERDFLDLTEWEFGEDIDDPVQQIGVIQSPRSDDAAIYAIAVGTFSGPGHQQSARQYLESIANQYPGVAGRLTVRERSRGSVLAFGSYKGYDDAAAKKDIEILKRIVTPGGAPLFGQLLISKFRTPLNQRKLHPNDLWSIRKEFPTVVPIYTLEIAIWGDFGSGEYPKSKRRLAAERYAAQIRLQGQEAFFYHNDDRQISSVTVGLFDYSAIDASSGFYSADVEAVLARFSKRLVNGEEVLEYLDPANPTFGTRIQPPCLVEVPVD